MVMNMFVLFVENIPLEFQRIEIDENDDCCSCPKFCDEFASENQEEEEE
jgi:hypothetical protein